MNDSVYRKTEIVGSSADGLQPAIEAGIMRARKTLRHLDWFEVTEIRGYLGGDDGGGVLAGDNESGLQARRVSDAPPDTPEPTAAVPVSELRKLADFLAALDLDLADDYVAGLANRVLRDLALRWADTVRVWAVEAELWGDASPGETDR